jgi:hypothetical protein
VTALLVERSPSVGPAEASNVTEDCMVEGASRMDAIADSGTRASGAGAKRRRPSDTAHMLTLPTEPVASVSSAKKPESPATQTESGQAVRDHLLGLGNYLEERLPRAALRLVDTA